MAKFALFYANNLFQSSRLHENSLQDDKQVALRTLDERINERGNRDNLLGIYSMQSVIVNFLFEELCLAVLFSGVSLALGQNAKQLFAVSFRVFMERLLFSFTLLISSPPNSIERNVHEEVLEHSKTYPN